MKITTIEPAERPYTINLSKAEVVALVKYHCAQARRIPKALGQATMELRAHSLFGTKKQSDALIKAAQKQLEAHSLRAKGLASILQ